jgi:hypothetical protein
MGYDSEKFGDLTDIVPGVALARAGTLRPRNSRQIERSPISIGCECLDRDCWDWEKGYPHLKQLGCKWARIQTGWAKCEQQKGVYDFAWLDKVVNDLLAINITPWFNVGYGNLLYTDSPGYRGATNSVPLANETQRAGWQAFLAKLADHFKGRVRHFEIWNEPDLPSFWGPEAPSPTRYAELVMLSAPVIRRHCPDAYIIAGVISYGARYCGYPFINGALKHGMGRHLDALSYHIYDPCPEILTHLEMDKLREIIASHGLTLDLWEGESGCPSKVQKAAALSDHPFTEHKQVKMLLRNCFIDLGHGANLHSYFHLFDFSYRANQFEPGLPTCYGLLRHPDYEPKPAFYAFQAACTLLGGDVRRSLRFFPSLHKTPEQRQLPAVQAVELDHLRMPIQRVSLERDALPLLAWWYPASIHQEALPAERRFTPQTVKLMMTHLGDDEIQDPVVIDLATRAVYRPTRCERINQWQGQDKTLVLHDMPVLDYPLVLADGRLVELA